MKKIFLLFVIVFASKIGLSWDVDPSLKENILVVGASPAQCPDIQEKFNETLKSSVASKSFPQKFSEIERFKEEASRIGLKNDLILRVENFSKTVLDPQFFIEQIVELRGDFSKTKPGTQIYQYPENSIFMDAQSSDLSGPLTRLWFGTPEALKTLKKSCGYFAEIHLNDMCKIDPTETHCDHGRGTDWGLILEDAASLLRPGGELKIAPCGGPLKHLDWDKLGFNKQSAQSQKIIHVQKHESFQKDKPGGENKRYGIIVSYIFKLKNLEIIPKKNDSISRWIHSNPSGSFIRNPQDFFRYVERDREDDRAKELREILNGITVKDLEEFVGNSFPRREDFLEENCNSLKEITEKQGNAALQNKLFNILFPLITWEDATERTERILDQCIQMGLTEHMRGLLKEKHKNDGEILLVDPSENLTCIFKDTKTEVINYRAGVIDFNSFS
jgi:hypothetical protein